MPDAETSTVRVPAADVERLRALAAERQILVVDVADPITDGSERRAFLRGLDQDYRELRADPVRWAAYCAEVAVWEAIE